jgi:hypothetical protein
LNRSIKGRTAWTNWPNPHSSTAPICTSKLLGEFKGWRTRSRDNFETHNGPFYHRMDDDGRTYCAFRVEKKHLNGMRNVHGGAFMAFADYSAPTSPNGRGGTENAARVDS